MTGHHQVLPTLIRTDLAEHGIVLHPPARPFCRAGGRQHRVPATVPDLGALTAAFGFGSAISRVERGTSGWGGRNVLWQLTTFQGRSAIKEGDRRPPAEPEAGCQSTCRIGQ